MVPEAPLEQGEDGVAPAGPAGSSLPLTGATDFECGTVVLRHGIGIEEEANDPKVSYARFPRSEPTPDRDGWLPSGWRGR